ncbi:hypothetical protein HME9304_00247 [Flagellimonas maritima]|uniref:AB hydrolase-1 domain-containing protein n=1 Tax=Flagellimonas maritima TaxID=1383885 RepID=A0A2Z4LNC5_9FLAO|nr:alpha/beta hydrolase [Allomuricauda aurantiaca]AWX43260.1 hypothetical protein HME9304_00247 [Allomuricauda aurantiaca]
MEAIQQTEKYSYELLGNGPIKLVLIHYFGGSSDSWKRSLRKLSKKITALSVTLPGFGLHPPMDDPSIYGYAKYVNELVDSLGFGDYTLCGHSMGAKIACYAAQINIENRPKKLILIAPSLPIGEKISEEERKHISGHPDKAEAISAIRQMSSKRLRKKFLEQAVNERLAIKKGTWQWWWNEGRQEDISDRIQGLDMPTYVICAKKDPVITMESIRKDVLPYLSLPTITVFGRCGHLIPLETPRKLAKRLNKILLG